MSDKITSFLIMFPISEIIIWGKDEYDDDDFYPHPNLQMLANHLAVPFPICHLYKCYFDGPLELGRACHFFRSSQLGNKTLLVVDLHIYDKTDQHDLIYLGIKCQERHVARVRTCLNCFLENMDYNPVIAPYKESSCSIDFLEEIIVKYQI